MSAEEREPFAEIAKQHKINKKFGVQQGDSDKMDCTRQLISVNNYTFDALITLNVTWDEDYFCDTAQLHCESRPKNVSNQTINGELFSLSWKVRFIKSHL